MDLAKLVVALGIAIFLSIVVSELFSLVYPMPKYTSSSSLSSTCRQIVTNKCGESTSTTNYSEYYKCTSEVYATTEYRDCLSGGTTSYQSQSQTYQIVSLLVFSIIGIVAVLLGFGFIRFSSIGSGLILGGIFIFLFAGVLSVFSGITSSLTGLLGASSTASGFSTILRVIRLFGSLIIFVLLICLSYFKLESEPD